MLDAFYQFFWYPLSLCLYHLVALPSMSMFPFRFQVKRWQKYLVILLAVFLSGSCAWLLRELLVVIHTTTGLHGSYFQNQLTHLIPIVLFSILLYKGEFYSIFLTSVLTLSLAGQIGFVYGNSMLLFWQPEHTIGITILRDILGYGSFAIFYLLLRRFSNVTSFYLNLRDHVILIVIALFNFWFSCYALGKMETQLANLIFYVTCTFATLAITFLLFRFTKEHQQSLKQQIALQDMRLAENELSQMSATALQIKTLKHELSNHFTYLETLLQQGQYATAKEYLKSVENLSGITGEIISTANPVVNSICNQKLSYARSLGIEAKVNVVLPEQMPLDNLTLCSLLGNLLNNAIEACASQDAPVIVLNIYPVKTYLMFQVDNSVTYDVLQKNPHLLSTKRDAENHGNGMRILQRIADTHNGILHYEMVTPDRFSVQVMLDMEDAHFRNES